MQKSFFRAKQPGPCRAQKRSRLKRCLASAGTKRRSSASDAWPALAQKEGPAQALCLAGDIKRRSPSQTCVCDGLPKNGGDLLSQLVGQYHRRG